MATFAFPSTIVTGRSITVDAEYALGYYLCMDITNTAAATSYETPMSMLRRVLPSVGFTASTDVDYMYRALRKPGMTNGTLKAAIAAWVVRTEAKMNAAR